MAEKEKFPSDLAERFQLRLPLGLRDRIKAYAERHGRSMNTEIVRILEREFPEPWSLDQRASELAEAVRLLRARPVGEALDRVVTEIEETIRAIASGRVADAGDDLRQSFEWIWQEIAEARAEDSVFSYDLDPEEREQLNRTGTTEKFTRKSAEQIIREIDELIRDSGNSDKD